MELFFYSLILFFALMGLPLFVVMLFFSITAFYFAEIPGSAVSIAIYQIADQPTLLTIPLFTFAGYLMAESKTPIRLLNFAKALMGWIPGGVAIICLVVCAFFTAFTGASGVTIIALGGLLYPILINEGHSEKFSLGIVTASGSLGLLFPPSLPIIIYGLVSSTDIDELFRAGILPGIFLILVLSLYSIFQGGLKKEREVFSFSKLKSSFKGAFWEMLLPVGVLGGIYGGLVTVTEAAAFTALYAFIIEVAIYKDIKIKAIPEIVSKSMSLVGAILLILCCSLAVTGYLVDEEVPMKILSFIKEYISNKYMFLFILNIFLLIVGCMMDIFSATMVVVPLIVPMAIQYDVNPIHLAIIFLTNLEIGYLTPPVGINLFISSFRFKKPVTEMYKVSIPFLIVLLMALMVITYFPPLSLYLTKGY